MRILNEEVLIERDETGWLVGSVPRLKGCHTQAQTKLRERLKEVISFCVEDDASNEQTRIESMTFGRA
jgi:predicted RNase H-like HicB family nuclease